MTDMRDFTSGNEVRAESAFIDTGANSNEIPIKESYTLDDSGGLGEFHRPSDQTDEISSLTKMLGGVALALMIGAAGAVAYSMYGPQTEVVADNSLPRTNAPEPAAVTPMAPPPPAADSASESMAPAATEPQSGTPTRPQTAMSPPAAPEMPRTAQTRVANAPARVAAPSASVTPAPVTAAPSPATVAPPAVTPPQQAATVPEPVSPTPPASAVAGNPPLNEQSAAPVTPAEAAPVTPAEAAPAETAPAAPEAQPAQPAPAVDQSQ